MRKVSVIIPTYKRSDYLVRAVKSVLSQTYSEVEAVVVDDNPPDSEYRAQTRQKITPYVGERVQYIQNEKNMGGALARNEGILHAKGDYITFLDDDDIYLPDKVRIQAEAMELHGWDMSLMDAEMQDIKGNTVSHLTHELPSEPDQKTLLVQHLISHLTPTASFMYRAASLRNIGGYEDTKTAHEYLLMLKSINAGLRIGYLPVCQLIQYIHPDERISTGGNKVSGENYLYSVKQRYFARLTPAQRRQVRVRHYATLFFVQFKQGKYLPALFAGLRAFFISPASACRLICEKKRMMRT